MSNGRIRSNSAPPAIQSSKATQVQKETPATPPSVSKSPEQPEMKEKTAPMTPENKQKRQGEKGGLSAVRGRLIAMDQIQKGSTPSSSSSSSPKLDTASKRAAMHDASEMKTPDLSQKRGAIHDASELNKHDPSKRAAIHDASELKSPDISWKRGAIHDATDLKSHTKPTGDKPTGQPQSPRGTATSSGVTSSPAPKPSPWTPASKPTGSPPAPSSGQSSAPNIGSASTKPAQTPAKAQPATPQEIEKAFDKNVRADFEKAQSSAQKKLAAMEKDIQKDNGFKLAGDADLREKLQRMKDLNTAFNTDGMTVAKEIAANRNDPAYKKMGPAQFASMEVTTRKLMETNAKARAAQDPSKPPKDYQLKTMERVCIYGYTTKDYTEINGKLRKSGGGALKNKELQQYVDHVDSGLKKLDDFNPKPGEKLYRGVDSTNLPPHVKAQYATGGQLQDSAFTSTSMQRQACPGDTILSIDASKGTKGKVLPFSAFAGEAEVLFPPNTKFAVGGNTPNSTKGLPPNPNAWEVTVL